MTKIPTWTPLNYLENTLPSPHPKVNSFFQEILRVLEDHPQPFHQLIVYNVRSMKEPIHCQTLPNITFRQKYQ